MLLLLLLVIQSCLTLCDPWTAALQALLSMEFSRQEYWNRLPFPSPVAYIIPYNFTVLPQIVIQTQSSFHFTVAGSSA